MRDYRANNPEIMRNIHLKKSYGITIEQEKEMLKAQNYSCWICKQKNTSKKRTLAVDHRHSDKKVRGILCYGCNRAISILDKVELLEIAQAYLKHFA